MNESPILLNRRGVAVPVTLFKTDGDFHHTVLVGVSGQGKSLAGRRVLSEAQLQLVAERSAMKAVDGETDIIAARPKGMSEEVAFTHAAILTRGDFKLNAHAPGNWLWQRVVTGTSVQHEICYMGYSEGARWLSAGMWVKACSTDLLTDKPQKHANALDVLDTSFADDGVAHLKAILLGLARNEQLWHASEFTEFDPDW